MPFAVLTIVLTPVHGAYRDLDEQPIYLTCRLLPRPVLHLASDRKLEDE